MTVYLAFGCDSPPRYMIARLSLCLQISGVACLRAEQEHLGLRVLWRQQAAECVVHEVLQILGAQLVALQIARLAGVGAVRLDVDLLRLDAERALAREPRRKTAQVALVAKLDCQI